MGRRKGILQSKNRSRNMNANSTDVEEGPSISTRRISTEYYSSEMTLENRFTSSQPSTRGEGDAACSSSKPYVASRSIVRGEILDTLLSKPYAFVRELEKGFDLNDIPDNFGCYGSPWNARSFANKMSTQFSSFQLTEGLENHVGVSDFISDWENIKSLITSRFDTNSRSVLLHKVGKSIFVDEFDLKALFGPKLYTVDWSWLENYANDVAGTHKGVILREGKSPQSIYARAAFHKLLHFGVEEKIQVQKQYKNEHSWQSQFLPPPPECNLQGSESKFLNKVKWTFGDYSMLLGTNIPVLNRKGGTTPSTVISQDSNSADKIELNVGLDAWLNNILMGVNETLVTYHKDGIVDDTKWIKTCGLPQVAGFDPDKLMEERDGSIFDFLKANVVENGNTYWLYKAPSSSKFILHNLTKLSKDQHFLKKQKVGFDVKDETNPYTVAVASLLYRSVHGCKMTLSLTTMESMLKHIISLTGTSNSELYYAAKYLLADLRVPTSHRFDQTKLRLLNGDTVDTTSGKSFNYNWHGETSLSLSAMENISEEYPELAALLCLEKVTADKAAKALEDLDKEYQNMSEVNVEEACSAVEIIFRHAKENIQVLKRVSETNPCVSIDVCVEDLHWSAQNNGKAYSKGRCSAEERKLQKYTAKIRKDKSKQRQLHLQEFNRPAIGEDCMKLLNSLDKVDPATNSIKPSDWIMRTTCTRLTCELVPVIKWLIACTNKNSAKEEGHLKYQLWLFQAKCKLGQLLRLRLNQKYDDETRRAISDLAITLLHTPPESSEENRKERSILNAYLANIISKCIVSHLRRFEVWISEKEDNQLVFEHSAKVLPKPVNNAESIFCLLRSHTGNPYEIKFPVSPSIPQKENNVFDYQKWALQVIETVHFANLLTRTSDADEAQQDGRSVEAVALRNSANVISKSLKDIYTDIADFTHYQNLRNLLLSVLNLYDAAFNIFAYNKALASNMAVSTALEMASLHSLVRRHCGKGVSLFRIVNKMPDLFSKLDAFHGVKKRLMDASKINPQEDVFNRTVWELSSLHLTQAFYCLESLQEISKEVDERSYNIVLEHLETSVTYIDRIRSTVYSGLDYEPDILSRRALISSVIGDIFRKRILMAIEGTHVAFNDLKSTCEPCRPDVFEHIIRAKYRAAISSDTLSKSTESRQSSLWQSSLYKQQLNDLCETALKNYRSACSKYNAISDPFLELSEFLRMKDVERIRKTYETIINGKDAGDLQSVIDYFVELLPKVQHLKNRWTNDTHYRQKLDINWNNLYDHKDEEWQNPESIGSKDYCFSTAPFPVLCRIIIRLWNHFGKQLLEENVDDHELVLFATRVKYVLAKFKRDVNLNGISKGDLSYMAIASFQEIGYLYGGKPKEDFGFVLLELADLLQFISLKYYSFSARWGNKSFATNADCFEIERTVEQETRFTSRFSEGERESESSACSNLLVRSQECFADTEDDHKSLLVPHSESRSNLSTSEVEEFEKLQSVVKSSTTLSPVFMPAENEKCKMGIDINGLPTAQVALQGKKGDTITVKLSVRKNATDELVASIQSDADGKENNSLEATKCTSAEETETSKQGEQDTSLQNHNGPSTSKKRNKKNKQKRRK